MRSSGAVHSAPVNWRWIFFDFIPPDVDLDADTRRRVKRSVRWGDVRLRGWPGARRHLIVAGVLVANYFAYESFLYVAGRRWMIPFFIGLMAVNYIIGLAVYAPARARLTYQELRRQGLDVCPTCGYWLHGLAETATTCPECGKKRAALPPPVAQEADGEETMPPRGFDQWS